MAKTAMNPANKGNVANFLGWTLLGYFVLETAIYIVTGRLLDEAKILLNAITEVEPAYVIYYTGRILSITVLPLYMIRVKKSDKLFMVAALLFILMGNIYCPFLPLFPKKFIPDYGEVRVIPNHFGFYWSITCLIILGMMSYHSGKKEKASCPANQADAPGL